MLSNAVMPPTNEHVFAQWREREEKSRTVNTTKLTGGLTEVKGEDGANLSTPLSRRPVSGQYRDLSMRLRLTGNYTSVCFIYLFIFLIFFVRRFKLLIMHFAKSTKDIIRTFVLL